jgi:hypothetical protein
MRFGVLPTDSREAIPQRIARRRIRELRAGLCGGANCRRDGGHRRRILLRASFRANALIAPETGSGFVTGFYEPEVEASPVRTPEKFTVPLLSRPDDLSMSTTATAPLAWIRTSPSAGRRRQASSNILGPRRDRSRRAAGQGAGDRLACRPGRCVLHPCSGRGAAEDDRWPTAPRHLCRQDRSAFTGAGGCLPISAKFRLKRSRCSRSGRGFASIPIG